MNTVSRHKPRHKQPLAAFLLMAMATTGCATRQPSPSPVAPPSSPSQNTPIIYTDYVIPHPLTSTELHEIYSLIADSGVKEPLWFIFVYANGRDSKDARDIYRVSVYFTPTQQDGRISRGNELFLTNDIPIARRRELLNMMKTKWPQSHPYVQISEPGVVQNASPPPLVDVPFSPPDGVSDSDLLDIVDIARRAAKEDYYGTHELQPVESIEIDSDAEIQVHLGHVIGPLYGGGTYVKLKRTGGSFQVIEVGSWYS